MKPQGRIRFGVNFVRSLVVFWKLKPHGGIGFGVNFCWGFGCVLEVETPWWDLIWNQLCEVFGFIVTHRLKDAIDWACSWIGVLAFIFAVFDPFFV